MRIANPLMIGISLFAFGTKALCQELTDSVYKFDYSWIERNCLTGESKTHFSGSKYMGNVVEGGSECAGNPSLSCIGGAVFFDIGDEEIPEPLVYSADSGQNLEEFVHCINWRFEIEKCQAVSFSLPNTEVQEEIEKKENLTFHFEHYRWDNKIENYDISLPVKDLGNERSVFLTHDSCRSYEVRYSVNKMKN